MTHGMPAAVTARNHAAAGGGREARGKMLPKVKDIRLKGKKLAQLNQDIHERDGYRCIIKGCGRHVLLGEKFHHEPCGAYKEDRIEKGCCLCYLHHQMRESKDGADIKRQCEEYLAGLYPNVWTGEIDSAS
jgi:hypothetical protein